MPKKPIKKYGAEVLRTKAQVVTKFDKNFSRLVKDMLQTMYAANGVGLAAPQIGISQRIVTIDATYGDDEARNPIVFVNPEIVFKEGKMESFEGCLSFPNVYFNVERYAKIVCKYYDEKGKEQRIEASENLLCRCIQHEIDHLDGKLFIDIATDKIIAKTELTKNGLGEVVSPPPGLII